MRNEDGFTIRIRELEVFAHHGVFADEMANGQRFYINADLFMNTKGQDMLEDRLEKTVDYSEVCAFFNEFMQNNTCALLEKITELMATETLLRYPLINKITLEIRKPEAPIDLPFESVSVVRTLSRHTAFLSIGSNIGDKHAHLDKALELLDACRHTELICESERFVTKPYGDVEQDDFVNSAVMIETLLSPHELLEFINGIEKAEGRTREIHWGPRTLDLDIIFYDDLIMSDSRLTIPHIDMENRLFVLKPLERIAGYYRHPILKKTVSQLLMELSKEEE